MLAPAAPAPISGKSEPSGTEEKMAASKRAANRYYSGPPSDHFDGTFFFNPDGVPPGRFADLLKWQLGGERSKWPAAWPSPFPQPRPDDRIAGSGLRLTMVGHASLLIQTAGLNILTDPVWSPRVSPLSFAGPKRVNAPGIAFSTAAADRPRAGQPQPLRPSRPRHAEAVEGDTRSAGPHAARQRRHHRRCGARHAAHGA